MNNKRILVLGGCCLAYGASFANISLVLHTGTSVSHLTGDISTMTVNLASWPLDKQRDLGFVVVAAFSFLLGAMASGALIHHPTLDFSRPYGRSITAIGVTFLAAFLLISHHPLLTVALSASACGFQNALAAHYRGLVLRTTHLTGMFTDLGVNSGMKLRGHDIPAWKILVPLALIVSFFCGGFSAVMISLAGYEPLFIAAIAYIIAGASWSVIKRTSSQF